MAKAQPSKPTRKVLGLLNEAATLVSSAQMELAQCGDRRADDLQKFRRRLNTQIRRLEDHAVGKPGYRYDDDAD